MPEPVAQIRSADFRPPLGLAGTHTQSLLASVKLRNALRAGHPAVVGAQRHELTARDGTRLVGWRSAQPGSARGLIVLIHGWEGCHDSIYLREAACSFFDAGYNVFRLNLRDHGGTHALNQAPFHSARIDEVIDAVGAAAALDAALPMHLVGYSLGGNFALRVALRGPARGVKPGLTVGVCPAINPRATLRCLDQGPALYHYYFLKKWRRTLAAKAAAWPGLYDFAELLAPRQFSEITVRFAERHTEFGNVDDYLAAYTLTAEQLKHSGAPIAIITAQDDPVVPYEDFRALEQDCPFPFLAPQRGGHCGFIESWRMRSWADRAILGLLRGS